MLYGNFPGKGGIGGILRNPGKRNWHKQIAPAIQRLAKRLMIRKDGDYYIDGVEKELWNTTKLPRYDFTGKDFTKATVV